MPVTWGAIVDNIKTATSSVIEITAVGSITDGDLLLIGAYKGANTSTAISSYPAGFTEIFSDGSGVNDVGCYGCAWKIADGESGTYDVTFTNTGETQDMWGFSARLSGTDTVNPIDVTSNATNSGSSGNGSVSAPDVTTTVDNCMIFRFGCVRHNSGGTNAFTNAETGNTERVESALIASVALCALYQVDDLQTPAGATGSAALASGGGSGTWGMKGGTFAIAPPAAAGAGGATTETGVIVIPHMRSVTEVLSGKAPGDARPLWR